MSDERQQTRGEQYKPDLTSAILDALEQEIARIRMAKNGVAISDGEYFAYSSCEDHLEQIVRSFDG